MIVFRILILFIFFVSVSTPVFAKETKKGEQQKEVMQKNIHNHKDHKGHKGHDHSKQEATIQSVTPSRLVIKVKGMVCAFCAQGIKKNFNKRKEVKTTKVDLDKMQVTIDLKEGKKLDAQVIEEIVTGAGFKFVGVQ